MFSPSYHDNIFAELMHLVTWCTVGYTLSTNKPNSMQAKQRAWYE